MDTRDIRLRIVTHQLDREGKVAEKLEYITPAKYYCKGSTTYIQYEEDEDSGLENCRTVLRITSQSMRMRRFKEGLPLDTVMEFRKGMKFDGMYDTPAGAIEMEVLTNEYVCWLSPGVPLGTISIDYHLVLKGLSNGRSRIIIYIEEEKENAKQ